MGIVGVWTVVKGVVKAVPVVLDFAARFRVYRKTKKLEASIDRAKQPGKSIEDTANAACELQRQMDPNSDCSS